MPITYDPTQLAGNMRLSEAEIKLAVKMYNVAGCFEGDFSSLVVGDQIKFTGEETTDDFEQVPVLELRLLAVEGGVTYLRDNEYMEIGEITDSFAESPYCKLFEADVISWQNLDLEHTKQVFGFLFPDNFAIVVDSAPDDNYTHRRIMAMIAVREAEAAQEM